MTAERTGGSVSPQPSSTSRNAADVAPQVVPEDRLRRLQSLVGESQRTRWIATTARPVWIGMFMYSGIPTPVITGDQNSTPVKLPAHIAKASPMRCGDGTSPSLQGETT